MNLILFFFLSFLCYFFFVNPLFTVLLLLILLGIVALFYYNMKKEEEFKVKKKVMIIENDIQFKKLIECVETRLYQFDDLYIEKGNDNQSSPKEPCVVLKVSSELAGLINESFTFTFTGYEPFDELTCKAIIFVLINKFPSCFEKNNSYSLSNRENRRKLYLKNRKKL